MIRPPIASAETSGSWLDDPVHRTWLRAEAGALFDFFRPSLRADGGFDVLDLSGRPLPGAQELHTTTRLIHSAVLGELWGFDGLASMIGAGMEFLWRQHRDTRNGGYIWAVGRDGGAADRTKLAYGHVFVLLAGSSAKLAGHPDADRLIADAAEVLDRHFWEEGPGLFCDEFTEDWQPFSTYRGMNANMHAVEALLSAHEATGEGVFLHRAGRILAFFVGRMAPAHGWRLPEHYTADWQVDDDYRGNPMFRPPGTTPGHSLELGRLALQHWDLCGRPATETPMQARRLIEQALSDAWTDRGGLVYTLDRDGRPLNPDRYWWPVTEAIGAVAALLKCDPRPGDEAWYRRLWQFADAHLIDHAHGGWFPEIDAAERPVSRQFQGKPDIYHAIQAVLFPLVPRLSHIAGNAAAA